MIREYGYTLLEMVVVVAILGLATSLVAPAGWRMAASWRESTQLEEVKKSLASLPLLARDEGRELRMESISENPDVMVFAAHDASQDSPQSDISLIELPEGWTLDFKEPLVVRPNGACSDGRGTLSTPRQTLDFKIEAPFCRLTPLTPDAH